jgi:hypothetical protein
MHLFTKWRASPLRSRSGQEMVVFGPPQRQPIGVGSGMTRRGWFERLFDVEAMAVVPQVCPAPSRTLGA